MDALSDGKISRMTKTFNEISFHILFEIIHRFIEFGRYYNQSARAVELAFAFNRSLRYKLHRQTIARDEYLFTRDGGFD